MTAATPTLEEGCNKYLEYRRQGDLHFYNTRHSITNQEKKIYKLSRNASRSIFCLGESLEKAAEISSAFASSLKNS